MKILRCLHHTKLSSLFATATTTAALALTVLFSPARTRTISRTSSVSALVALARTNRSRRRRNCCPTGRKKQQNTGGVPVPVAVTTVRMSNWAGTWKDILQGGNPRWKITSEECHAKAYTHFKKYVPLDRNTNHNNNNHHHHCEEKRHLSLIHI